MTSCCCWFIQPASEISKSRKGSRARVIATSYTPERPLARQTALSMAFCFQRHRVFGHYGVATGSLWGNGGVGISEEDLYVGYARTECGAAQCRGKGARVRNAAGSRLL